MFGKNLKRLSVVMIFAFGAVACGGGGGGGAVTSLTFAESWVKYLNQQDNLYYYTLVKDPTNQYGYIVVDDGVEYRAIDILDPDWDLYYLDELEYFDYESIVVYDVGNGYFEDNDGYLYEMSVGTSKDLEKLGGFMQNLKAQKLGSKLAADYGLSEKRGIEVAKLSLEWNKLSNKRVVTDADADAFSTDILGFSLTDGIKAFEKAEKEGEVQDLESLLDKAAESNGISPENVKDIMTKFLTQGE